MELSTCGHGCGGHGCGSHACGGHSNCGGHDSGHGDDGGSGHHHPNNPHSDNSDANADCGAGESPDSRSEDKTPSPPGNMPSANKNDKRGILQRIFNLAPSEVSASWYTSVTPALFDGDEFRPGEPDIESLTAKAIRSH